MRKKNGRTAAITAAVAAVMVIALMVAGTIVRMRARDLSFPAALRSFVADIFNPGSGA